MDQMAYGQQFRSPDEGSATMAANWNELVSTPGQSSIHSDTNSRGRKRTQYADKQNKARNTSTGASSMESVARETLQLIYEKVSALFRSAIFNIKIC